ncbi:ATPase, T2SS/T4P/T4SS family [Agathobaculum desmolans]|uniref:ATPase, T2SS/T4P/T4SS family n=1 Tax=Agathobaculum desmolans TaxID=39484 RepID=UPI00248E6AF2|nr:ATPase, T2SS/T4P/T4SS family [Agathobaculum desmolans]
MGKNLYTLENLIRFVTLTYGEQTTAQSTLQRLDQQRMHQRDRLLRYDQECFSGDPDDKLFIKSMLFRIMTDCGNKNSAEFPAGYGVNRETVDRFIDWNATNIDPYLKFLAMLLHYKIDLGYGAEAFGEFITAHNLQRLRHDADGSPGFYIDAADIDAAWKKERLVLDYDKKVEILNQIVYEEIKGNSCIDELLYQNLGDISTGVSGIPDSLFAGSIEDYEHAYDTCWVRYKGNSIHLRFLTFGSYSKLKDVVRKGVAYEMKGQFSEKEGFKLGYAKDGSRRTAAIEPFGESPALWVRKFTAKNESNESLFGNAKDFTKVMDVEKILVRGGATLPVCGAQGSGKTTKLEALCAYIQNFYAIRVMESEFEARLRWKYPKKNIFTVEANENTPVSPAEAYNFSLRTAGDIYIIGEARGDDSIVNVTRTANRGGRSVLFTFHPNSPKATISEIANALIRQKMYANLKDAVATALETVHCCIFVRMDIEAQCRYYEIYEFVPRPNGLPADFMQETNPELRQAKFMETMYRYMQYMTSADIYYDTVPIVVYDRVKQMYRYANTLSDGFYEDLRDKTPLQSERDMLERTFRPEVVMDRLLAAGGIGDAKLNQADFEEICKAHQLNTDLLTFDGYQKRMARQGG